MNIKTKKKEKPEKKIQREILDWLFSKDYLFWRNKPNVNFVAGVYRKTSRYDAKGSGDIFGVINGRFISIEVKTKTGKLSPFQKEFMKNVNDEGGIAFVARSVEDVEKELFLL